MTSPPGLFAIAAEQQQLLQQEEQQQQQQQHHDESQETLPPVAAKKRAARKPRTKRAKVDKAATQPDTLPPDEPTEPDTLPPHGSNEPDTLPPHDATDSNTVPPDNPTEPDTLLPDVPTNPYLPALNSNPNARSILQAAYEQAIIDDKTPAAMLLESAEPSDPHATESGRRKRVKWSTAETVDLIAGCTKHGVGNWTRVLKDPEYHFLSRSSIDLKDRYVHMHSLSALSLAKFSRFRTIFPDAYAELYPGSTSHLTKIKGFKDKNSRKSTAIDWTASYPMLLDQPSQLPKVKRKDRCHFTQEEDDNLLAGFEKHGASWSKIREDLLCHLDHRRATDLRDRFRNAFPDKYLAAGYKLREPKTEPLTAGAEAGEPEASTSASVPAPPRSRKRAAPAATIDEDYNGEGASTKAKQPRKPRQPRKARDPDEPRPARKPRQPRKRKADTQAEIENETQTDSQADEFPAALIPVDTLDLQPQSPSHQRLDPQVDPALQAVPMPLPVTDGQSQVGLPTELAVNSGFTVLEIAAPNTSAPVDDAAPANEALPPKKKRGRPNKSKAKAVVAETDAVEDFVALMPGKPAEDVPIVANGVS